MNTNQYNNNLLSKYCVNIFKAFLVPNFGTSFKKIISSHLNFNIINHEFMEKHNTLKIILDVNINIIYISNINSTLLSKSIKTSIVKYIYLPEILGGNIVNKYFVENNINFEISDKNIYTEFISCDSIAISINLSLDLCFLNTDYMIYVLNNEFHDCLTSSFFYGNDLTKEMYKSNFVIKNLKWLYPKNKILFLESIDNNSFISSFDISKKIKIQLTDCDIYKNIICFTFIDSYNLLFYNQSYKNNFFYIININTYKVKKLPLIINCLASSNIHYDKINNLLYFVTFKNNNYLLYSYDLKNNCNLVFENSNISDFIINKQANKAIIKTVDKSLDKLFMINLDSNICTQIPIEFSYIEIKKFNFYKPNKINSCILILLRLSIGFQLIEYNIYTCTFEIIYFNKNITTFEIDSNTNDIIIISRNNHISEVINVSSNKILFKSNCYIKELCIKSKI